MNVTEALKAAGFTPEKSTVGDKPIFVGTYRASLFDVALMEDKGYGKSIYAQFKIQDTLEGVPSHSKFPEFKGYFSLAPDKIGSKRKGLAKLIVGLFSVGLEVNTGNANMTEDESHAAVLASLNELKGSEVFISGYKEEPRKQVDGVWVDDPDGETKQAFTFLTKANAEKRVAKAGVPF